MLLVHYHLEKQKQDVNHHIQYTMLPVKYYKKYFTYLKITDSIFRRINETFQNGLF